MKWITELKPGEIFVFGSNLRGIHGAGAAKTALQWGAKYGQASGLQGQTYAIPTKDADIETMTVEQIKPYVDIFIEFAKSNPGLTFLVTDIGCGLAAHDPKNIAPLFEPALPYPNIILPDVFKL